MENLNDKCQCTLDEQKHRFANVLDYRIFGLDFIVNTMEGDGKGGIRFFIYAMAVIDVSKLKSLMSAMLGETVRVRVNFSIAPAVRD